MKILLDREECSEIIVDVTESLGYPDSDFIADRIKRAQLKKVVKFIEAGSESEQVLAEIEAGNTEKGVILWLSDETYKALKKEDD